MKIGIRPIAMGININNSLCKNNAVIPIASSKARKVCPLRELITFEKVIID